jgi:AcrR family transcriptional regulator
MKDLLSKVSIQVNDRVYLKNPETSELGKKIIKSSIELIDELGFESFTFRKLAIEIGSTEASVYRYFESKHKLLLYLTAWYWGWMEYRLVFGLANITSAESRLEKALVLLTEVVQADNSFSHINEAKLNNIVISESSKTYLTKEVDQENKEGVFAGFKRLIERVSNIVLEINPAYKYPHMLISTVIEGAHIQRYFADHLPKVTDSLLGEDSITEFYKHLVLKTVKS